jgi:methylthioribose-1-phosphate isomerase
MAPPVEPVRLAGDASAVRIIDQRSLPGRFVERDLRTLDDIEDAIRTLAVRGAPAIGLCAAAGLAVLMRSHADDSRGAFLSRLDAYAARLSASRPTAVNLGWAVDRSRLRAQGTPGDGNAMSAALVDEAHRLHDEDLAMSRAIGAHGLSLLGREVRALTHCNAGALATAGGGTALAPR